MIFTRVNELALANKLREIIGNMLIFTRVSMIFTRVSMIFTRVSAGYCPICKCEHVNDNTHFVIVHDQVVCLHCRCSETHCGKKTTLVLGHLDSSNTEGLRRAMSITTDKIPEVFEQQNIQYPTEP